MLTDYDREKETGNLLYYNGEKSVVIAEDIRCLVKKRERA